MSDKDSKDTIDLKKVKELIELMKENDLIELEVAAGHNKIQLKRPSPAQPTIAHVPVAAPVHVSAAAPIAAPQDYVSVPTQPAKAEEKLIEITSPIVGTFYAAPSPESKPYVKEGDRITPETTVCIVEAMKVMNEIKAETAGTIVEILCRAGQAVEYGQVLFKVKS